MTKRLIHILALTAVLCASCAKDMPVQTPGMRPSTGGLGYAHDGKVTYGFNPDFGFAEAGTKAMTETSDIKNIYVAVFDNTGYKLSEYVKAQQVEKAEANDTDYRYTVELKISDKPRVLHFIANAPEDLRFGSEQEVIGSLSTKYDADESNGYPYRDAYWQRVVLDKVAPMPVTDDADSLEAFNAVVSKLNSIRLVRNYSKVTCKSTCDNFELTGFWFVNYPERGTVAPYNRNTGDFMANYLDYTSVKDMEDKDKGNYQGFMLASTEFITPEMDDDAFLHAAEDGICTGYVYEREKALTSPLYLVIQGHYRTPGSTAPFPTTYSYYKVALQDTDGNFYAMLRNFNYLVKIEEVTTAGKSTPAEAVASVPSGDISLNVDFQEMPNISDGNARITVNATSVMLVGQEGHPATAELWYKYEPDISGHAYSGIHNDTYEQITAGLSDEDDIKAARQAHPYVQISIGEPGSTGNVIDDLTVSEVDAADGCRHITITSTDVAAMSKIQTITITGYNWDGSAFKTITRSINLSLRTPLDFKLSATPNTDASGGAFVKPEKDQPIVLNLGIEPDLPSSAFPLNLKIRMSVYSLTPDSDHSSEQDLPVRYGTGDDGRPEYWFEKTINWPEYDERKTVDAVKTFPVYFTTMYRGANATDITVSHELFNDGHVSIQNYIPAHFTDISLIPSEGSEHKVGQVSTLSFKMDKSYDGTVTFAFTNLEPAAAAGFKFKEIDKQGRRVYTKTVNAEAGETVSFNIIPYAGGQASIDLSADLLDDGHLEAFVSDDDAGYIYVNTSGTDAGTRFVNISTTKVAGEGNLVYGMKGTLTVYIAESKAVANTIILDRGAGNITLTKVNSDTSVPGFKAYSGSYDPPTNSETGYNDVLSVYAGTELLGSVTVPVYGIRKDAKLTSAAFETDKYYLIQYRSEYYMYNPGTNNAQSILQSEYDYSSLMQFGSAASPTTIKTVSTSTQYYLQMNRTTFFVTTYTPRLSTSSSDWNIATSGTGMTIQDSSYDRYVYGDGGSIKENGSNSDYNWYIYPVTFVAP